jgi:phosphatidylglycerol---prolipoprotein diacylglyceryl transferase
MTDILNLIAMPMVASGLKFPEFSPAIFSIDFSFIGLGTFHLRWYALAYIAGIMLAWKYAGALIARPAMFGGTSPATKDDLDDIMFWIILGIILGGRLGYVLFYMVPYQQDVIAANPMSVLKIWDGGMSFHGGLIGVTLAIILGGGQRKLSLLPLGDIAGVVAPIGIMFGRLANFINAELYDRKTDSTVNMIFPEGVVPGSTPPAYD